MNFIPIGLQRIAMTDSKLLSHCSRFSHFVQAVKGCVVILVATYEGLVGGFIAYIISHSYAAAVIAFLLYGALILCFDMLINVSYTRLASICRTLFLCFAALIMRKALMLFVLRDDINQAIEAMYSSKQLTAHKPVTDAKAKHEAEKSRLNSELAEAEARLQDWESKALQEANPLYGKLGRNDVSHVAGKGKRYQTAMAEAESQRRLVNGIKARIKNSDADFAQNLSIAKDQASILQPAVKPLPSFLNQWAGMYYLIDNEQDPSRKKSYQHISVFLFCLASLFSLTPVIIHNAFPTDYSLSSQGVLKQSAGLTQVRKDLRDVQIQQISKPTAGSDFIWEDTSERIQQSIDLGDIIIQDSRLDYGKGAFSV